MAVVYVKELIQTNKIKMESETMKIMKLLFNAIKIMANSN